MNIPMQYLKFDDVAIQLLEQFIQAEEDVVVDALEAFEESETRAQYKSAREQAAETLRAHLVLLVNNPSMLGADESRVAITLKAPGYGSFKSWDAVFYPTRALQTASAIARIYRPMTGRSAFPSGQGA